MSDQELYDIARQRIDRRNRRWTLWAFNLAGLIFSVAALILLSETEHVVLGVAFMIFWAGIFVLHTIITALAHVRDDDIDKELAKLRNAAHDKPKRMVLSEDGEIADYAEWEQDEAERRLKS
jgi:hypothetical protein